MAPVKSKRKKAARAGKRDAAPRLRPTVTSTPITSLLDAQHGSVRVEPLTVRMEQAVAIANVGETFLRERIRDGSLKTTKLGRTRLIDFASLKALVGAASAHP